MLSLAFLLFALQAPPSAGANRVAQCQALTKTAGAPTTVHGRLYAANGGGSGFRLWIVGTKRIVWLTPKIDPSVPGAIRSAFTPFDEELYGDFTFVPLQPEQPGVMREVCLVSGANLSPRHAAATTAAATASSPASQWSDADWRWLDTWRDAAFDALMPLKPRDGQGIAYRRFRDVHQDVAEVSFAVTLAGHPGGHAAAATLIEPAGSSIQTQLLQLHAADREAPLQTLLPRVSIRRLRLAKRACPSLDAQLRAVPRLVPDLLTTAAIAPHPVVQRLVVHTTSIDADLTVFDSRSPVGPWSARLIAAIRACGVAAPPS